MKKFLVFFVVVFGIVGGAMAGYEGTQSDSKGGNGSCIFRPNNANEDAPYAVYFKTGEYTVSSECGGYFDKVKNDLKKLWQDGNVAYFVVVASADGQGDQNGFDNGTLSTQRYNYVITNGIVPNGAKIDRQGWVSGSVSSNAFGDSVKNPEYRSVYIYPVWARPECTNEIKKGIEDNLKLLQEAGKKYPESENIKKLIGNYTEAQQICNRGPRLGKQDSERLAFLLKDVLIQEVSSEYNINLESYDLTLNTKISGYYSELHKIIDTLKLNVWRDADGNFNTARLASDSIAGVVLGTVGGIVTANVVKKNQLKKGFEDIQCYIGGQSVADYGDGFVVGR